MDHWNPHPQQKKKQVVTYLKIIMLMEEEKEEDTCLGHRIYMLAYKAGRKLRLGLLFWLSLKCICANIKEGNIVHASDNRCANFAILHKQTDKYQMYELCIAFFAQQDSMVKKTGIHKIVKYERRKGKGGTGALEMKRSGKFDANI